MFMKVWGCIHTYFLTSVFLWSRCLWKWGSGNKKKTLVGTNYKWESCCPPADCTGMLGWSLPCSQLALGLQVPVTHGGRAGNQDPTSLREHQQHSPLRSRHQPRTKQSIKYSREGKGLKKGACWSFRWGDVVLLSEKALRIYFALPEDSSLRGKQLLCKSTINMADT